MKNIIIISPAGKINTDLIYTAKKKLELLDFNVSIADNANNKYYHFAGTDSERLEDFQKAINNDNIDIILCARGGYGLIRIINEIDFSPLKYKHKWLVGFSDITNIHLALNRLNIKSIHGQMVKNIAENTDSDAVKKLISIFENNYYIDYKINTNILNRYGDCTGELIGGNLSIIYSLQGTKFEIVTDGKILFFEDVNEYLYNIDRMIVSLKLAGKFKNLKGLIVGQFTDIKNNNNPFGKNAYEIIKEHTAEYNYPICFGFSIGHTIENLPLICGENYELFVSEDYCKLRQL